MRRLVYLCALLAAPGRTFNEQFGSEPDILLPGSSDGLGDPDEQGRRRWVDFAAARRTFYGDCSEADARAAFERLRPQARTPYAEPCPLDAMPDAERTYVLCTEDGIVNPGWSRRAVRERLAVEPLEIPGDHSPFYSRPAELARLLHEAG